MKTQKIKTELIALSLALLALAGCGQSEQTTTVATSAAGEQIAESSANADVAQPAMQAGGDMSCSIDGAIDHDSWNASQHSDVTFTHFPASLREFESAFSQLAGEPQGAVALQVMAFELYRRNPAEGEKALKMVNTDVNCTQTLRQLKQMMDTKDAVYARPYLAAALLRGATPDNGYTPDEPYTLQVRVNPVSKYQESEMLGGTVIYLQVDSKGWDTNWRGVEVVKPEGSDHYLVSNCPALYTQCKKVKGAWKEPK